MKLRIAMKTFVSKSSLLALSVLCSLATTCHALSVFKVGRGYHPFSSIQAAVHVATAGANFNSRVETYANSENSPHSEMLSTGAATGISELEIIGMGGQPSDTTIVGDYTNCSLYSIPYFRSPLLTNFLLRNG